MHTDYPGPAEAPDRGRYRPPVGIPARYGTRRWPSTLLSVALHLLIVLLIVAPFAAPVVLQEVEGAGGPGPAGGGGGGTGGTGGLLQERLQYLQVARPAPAVKVPSTQPQLVVPPPPPKPPEPKPEPKPEPVPPPAPAPPPQAAAPAAAPAVASAATPGEGGGTGTDGTAGSGPGMGGGVGSGVGTGRGSGVGPGTGGGTATVYPPQPIEVFIPPMPIPGKVKGTELVAVFDVDSTGKVLTFDFTQTRDGGYNRKLREVLAAVRFRPATRADGTPVRAKGSLAYSFF